MAGGWWLVFYSSNYQIFFRKKNVPGFFKLDQVFDIGLKVEICTKLKLSEPGNFLQNLVKKTCVTVEFVLNTPRPRENFGP